MTKEKKRERGRPRGTKKEGQRFYLNKSERDQFMRAVRRGKSKRDGYLFELIFYLGLRCVEASMMKLENIDDLGLLHMKGVKSGLEREYDLRKKEGLWNLHKAWLRERAKFPGSERNSYLFITERSGDNKPIDRNTIQYLFKMYARKAGLNSRYSVHSLRHTAGAFLAEQGFPAQTIMRWLRQRKITSAQEYINLVGVEARKEEDKIAKVFNS
jgi:integrase